MCVRVRSGSSVMVRLLWLVVRILLVLSVMSFGVLIISRVVVSAVRVIWVLVVLIRCLKIVRRGLLLVILLFGRRDLLVRRRMR